MRHKLALPALLALANLLPAQTRIDTEYLLYGGIPATTDWELRRTVDTDNDGLFTSAGEGWQFAFDATASITFVEDMRYTRYNNTPSFFFSHGGANPGVMRAVDGDGDGVALSPGEVTVFADFDVLYPAAAFIRAKGVDFDPNNGLLYATNDAWSGSALPGNGLTRMLDLNGNGNCHDPGESALYVNGQGSHSVLGSAGQQVTIGLTDFEGLMVDSNGVAIVFEQQDRMLYAFQDQNGDGDAMDPGEAWNFCNLIDDLTGLTVNADILSGVMPPPRCPSTGTILPGHNGWYGDLDALSCEHGAGPGGADVYWIASIASNSSCSTGNGFVYRGVDLNGDYDLNDAGEVRLWIDGANNSFMLYPVTSIYDGEHHDGGFSIFQGNGPFGTSFIQDSVYWLKDLNGDGDAMDNGEQFLRYYWQPDGAFTDALCSVPFGEFAGAQVPSFRFFGTPGTTSSGSNPAIGHVGLPALGAGIDVTLSNATIASGLGTTATLIVGGSDTVWNRPPLFNLPLDLGAFGAPGNTLYASVNLQFATTTTPSGDALLSFTVPSSSTFAGRSFYLQWYIVDTAANARGVTLSDALHGVIY